jgi:CRISPR-associated protein Csd1
MIAELVKYADSIPATGREPFRSRVIGWLIDLDSEGGVLGFVRTTGGTEKKGHSLTENRGKRFSGTPANYLLGSPNDSNWKPDFLSGPVAEIFPAGVDGKSIYRLRDVITARKAGGKKFSERNRLEKLGKWRRLVFRCETTLPNNQVIRAIANFIRDPRSLAFSALSLSERGDEQNRLLDSFREGNETLSFRVAGKLAVADSELRHWWAHSRFPEIYAEQATKCSGEGADAFQPGTGKITRSSPSIFGNVPLVSFNAAPFKSYGLGDETARLRLDTVEKAAAALNALQQGDDTSLTLGDQRAIFWAVQGDRPVTCSFVTLLEAHDPLAVADYLKSIWGAMPRELEHAAFHVAILEKGTGRFSVRSWDSRFLGDVDRNFREYFAVVRLPASQPVTLGAMASSTIPKSKKNSKTRPASSTYNAIFNAAWSGSRLPHRLLECVVMRQSIELAKGKAQDDKFNDFESRLRARTALIKLYFQINHRITMNETTHQSDDHLDAYRCGQVLAVFDKIHNEAHGQSTASSPAGRYYGSASSTPALVFPRLCKLARIHLEKIQNGHTAGRLDLRLTSLIAAFSSRASWPRTLSLEQQGQFAIGFYYERAQS